MPLTDEQKGLCISLATDLKTGDWDSYQLLRANIDKYPELKSDGSGDALLAVIFNLLPQTAQDIIASNLMIEALEEHAKTR